MFTNLKFCIIDSSFQGSGSEPHKFNLCCSGKIMRLCIPFPLLIYSSTTAKLFKHKIIHFDVAPYLAPQFTAKRILCIEFIRYSQNSLVNDVVPDYYTSIPTNVGKPTHF
jgi:hypothetical protein